MTDRLTIAAARPGMRVRCVDAYSSSKLHEGATYTIDWVWKTGGEIALRGVSGRTFYVGRFVLAAARPGMRVDRQVLLAAQSMDDAQRSNPAWLWYSEQALTFGRWHRTPTQAPYIRADLVPADDQPTLAALLAERWPEFLAAVLDRFNRCASKLVPPDYAQGYREAIEHVREEVERAGLIAQEPRTPFRLTPQQFQEMHNAG